MFHVLERAREHRSNLYDAEMPYMLRLTNDGVAIHASKVREGSATHGCIGVPLEFARRLFDVIHRGDLVVIATGDKRTSISSAVGTTHGHRGPHPA
jgi:lipoprotein-anchoring transpeptidase ErfK/SrfK